MKIKLLFICILLFSNGLNLFSQENLAKYLVQFKDKTNTTFSINKPEEFLSKRAIDRRLKQNIKITTHDLPPNNGYINDLLKAGAKVWYKSRWYNGALVLADSATALKIKALPFVKGFENNGPLNLNGTGNLRKQSKFNIELDSINYGNGAVQAKMLGTHHLQNAGFKGKGMMIGVLDDGFNKVDNDANMKHLFDEKRVISTFDFVRNTPNVYDIGGHGNLVLSTMAANNDGTFVGTAPEASYVLLRSEDAPTEKIIEEANWLFAAEFADSVGVDVINSSLGYLDFDYSPYNHTKADLDGDKILSTKAADWAAQAGILVVASAGNSGFSGIGSPADGDSVLAIGAVTSNKIRSSFSSVGPTADGRIKPDLSAMGTATTVSVVNSSGATQLFAANGTSFSGPIFAGFAACFWHLNPNLKVMELHAELKKLGNQKDKPDNLLGWGIPEFGKVVILGQEPFHVAEIEISPNPASDFLKIKLIETLKNKIYNLQIYNTLGNRIVILENQKSESLLKLNSVPIGLYFGEIRTENQSFYFKFLKQ